LPFDNVFILQYNTGMTKYIITKTPKPRRGGPRKAMTFRLSLNAIRQLELIAEEMHWTKTASLEECIMEAPLPRIDFDKFTRPIKKEKP